MVMKGIVQELQLAHSTGKIFRHNDGRAYQSK